MKLRIETPQGTREYVAREGATYVMIGSRPTDDISLPNDPAVSDPHARLEFLGKWTVADQFSATGTIHNGKKAYTADLAPGDVIQIGSARITVLELEGVAAASAPAPALFAPPSAPSAAASDAEVLYNAMVDALRREGDDPAKDPEESERLRTGAREAVARDPHMARAWISLLHNSKVDAGDVIDAITGDLDADLSDLDEDSRRVAEFVIDEFRRRHGVDLLGNALAMQRIGDAADEAVGRIRESGSADINLPYIAASATGPVHLNVRVTSDVLAAPAPERAAAIVVPFQPMAPAPRSGAPFAIVGVLIVIGVATASGVVFFGSMRRAAARVEAMQERDRERAARTPAAPEREPQPKPDPEPPPRRTPPKPGGLSPERTKELETALKAIAEDATEANAVERLKDLEAIEAEVAKETQHGLRWPLERARLAVEQAIMLEMQRRYGKDNGDIYHLKEKSLFREADERLKALAAHLKQTTTHTKLAKRMEMDKYLEEQPPVVAKGNDDFVAKTFGVADELLVRRQYATAAEQLGILGTQAILTEDVAKHVETEKAHWEELAAKQKEGNAEPPIPLFDPRRNRPPPAPASGLLPKGETSALAAQRAIDKRLEAGLKNGTIVGTVTTHFGREATVEKPDDWRMKLRVKRPFAGTDGAEITFDVRYSVNQLPAKTRLGLLETLKPTRDELVALVIYAFAYGLADDAARLACTLWKTDESVKADLDALLAAKLRIAVPEGGFIERDRRLVPK